MGEKQGIIQMQSAVVAAVISLLMKEDSSFFEGSLTFHRGIPGIQVWDAVYAHFLLLPWAF